MPQEGYNNLIGPGDRTPDERRASAVKAGKASGESRRRRKTIAEVARAILDSPERDPETLAMLQQIGLDGTTRDSMTLAQIMRAIRGDPESFRLVRDTIGEKPRDEIELGNLDGRPFESLDLSSLTNDQLRALAARRADVANSVANPED